MDDDLIQARRDLETALGLLRGTASVVDARLCVEAAARRLDAVIERAEADA